ncbi:MAG TPA: hypothetical protein VMS18_12245 [Candidatus Binatia bacterium]|nr:hypothetical protein [Candidatus Binatia bacterium]
MAIMLGEEDHGLGINREVEASKVFDLEQAIYLAAKRADLIGVPMQNFLDMCEAALDVAGANIQLAPENSLVN